MRFVAFIFFLLVSVMAFSQQNITAKTITLSQYMKLRGVRVDSISIDGTFSTPSHFTLPTTRAVYDFIQALNVIPDWSDITNIPAGFADGVDNVDDADNSPTNELQSLSIAGDSLGISGGNKVRIPTADSLSQLVNDAGYITKSLYTDSDTLPTGRTAYVQDTFQFVLDAFLTTIKVGAQYNVYDVNFWGSDFKSWGTYYEGISGQGFSGTDGYSFIRDARNEEYTSHEYFGAGTVERYVSNGDETVTEGIAADEYSLSATNGTNTGSLSVTGNVTELVTTSTGTSEISRVQSLGNGAMLSTTQGTQVGRVYAERDHIQSAIIVDGTPIVAIEHEIGDTSITVHNESGKGMEYDEEPTNPTPLTFATKGYVDSNVPTISGSVNHIAYYTGPTTLSYDASQLYWDATNNRLGVGTASPGYALTVNGFAVFGQIQALSNAGGIDYLQTESGRTNFFIRNKNATGVLTFGSGGGIERMRLDNTGRLGIGQTSPTAYLHLPAGTASASTAPIKLTSGTNLTTPEAGAVEWDGIDLYVTQTSGPTRKKLAYADNVTTMEGDSVTATTNGSGIVTVSHSLGTTPTAVTVSISGAASPARFVIVDAKSSTNIDFQFFDSSGSLITATSVTFDWIALK